MRDRFEYLNLYTCESTDIMLTGAIYCVCAALAFTLGLAIVIVHSYVGNEVFWFLTMVGISAWLYRQKLNARRAVTRRRMFG